MKKHLFVAGIATAFAAGMAFAADKNDQDPVLMTVGGRPVHVSEFEYLYNKNKTQQLQQQTIDEYLQMFIDYKLKVADAEANGIQNTPEFKNEFESFRNDLARPYLRDNSVEEELLKESYGHRYDDVLVSHIMMPQERKSIATLDSVRADILAGKTTFEEQARKLSIDRNSSVNGGLMGYVVPDRFPWAFEKASYDTPVGQISPVVNSGMGYHLIRVEKRTPASGQVHAAHILLMTRGLDEAAKTAAKARIDSIYSVATDSATFAELAHKFSQDPGSARKGGDLGFFGRGQMVAEFDSVSFALADGEISRPFETSFGYHIIHRIDHRGVAPLDELRKSIMERMKNDERGRAPEEAFTARLLEQYGATVDQKGLDNVCNVIKANGGYLDSTAVANLTNSGIPVARYGNNEVMVGEVLAAFPMTVHVPADQAREIIAEGARNVMADRVMDIARDNLAAENAEYRNLVNEYRDGILLYEISNRNVWDKAAKDTEGLNEFFKKNIEKYAWEQPKFKSYIIFATSDSILNAAVGYAGTLSTENPAAFTESMKKAFGREIKVERVIAAKGENPITDYLGFGGPQPEPNKSKWKFYAPFNGRVIDAPEEASDVRGAAVTDFQTALDKEWLKNLHKKYKVKVNNKVFKKLKEK